MPLFSLAWLQEALESPSMSEPYSLRRMSGTPPPNPNSAVYCSVVLCCWANSLTSPSCSLIHHTVGSNHHLPGLSSFSPCKLLCIQHLLSRCVTVLHCVPHVSLTGCALGGELGTPALAAVDTRTWEEKPACGGRRSPSMP